MKITELRTFKGYPHFLIMKGNIINLVSLSKVNVGDGFTFGWKHKKGQKNMTVHVVEEILEERDPKGKKGSGAHPNDAIFYSFRTNSQLLDTSEIDIINSDLD